MTEEIKTLKQFKKATTLVNRAFHKNGPKSFKKGQGALIKVLHHKNGEANSRELVDILSFNRSELKRIVRKAQRCGYVEMKDAQDAYGYNVVLTELGSAIAEKRCKAQAKVAQDIMGALTEEELKMLNELTDKLITSCKDLGAHGKHKNSSCKEYRNGSKRYSKCA